MPARPANREGGGMVGERIPDPVAGSEAQRVIPASDPWDISSYGKALS